MIRKLSESDRTSALEFLRPEATINLFFIGDIEQDGFDKDFQEFWGSFDDDGQLHGMLLRYDTNYIPYSPEPDFYYSPFMDIIKNDPSAKQISGKGSIVSLFKAHFPSYLPRETYFCELKKAPAIVPSAYKIKEAILEDAKRISDLLNEIEEFSDFTYTPESIERILSSHCGRIYYTETEDGILQNVVQTTAENTYSAMVVGVATRKAYRHQGLLRSTLSKLCNDMIAREHKSLCLFYDNPAAGKVYHSVGFKTIDSWLMLIDSSK